MVGKGLTAITTVTAVVPVLPVQLPESQVLLETHTSVKQEQMYSSGTPSTSTIHCGMGKAVARTIILHVTNFDVTLQLRLYDSGPWRIYIHICTMLPRVSAHLHESAHPHF